MKRLSILFLLNLCLISIISAQTTATDSAQVAVPDSTDVRALNEVEITAESVIHKDGYDLLFLSKANKEFETNALDAISSMSQFLTGLNGDGLVLWDRTEVFILIDGVPSTATELAAYKGDDIKNVKFYHVAPPQYMVYTTGAVVDVILKKDMTAFFQGTSIQEMESIIRQETIGRI